MTHFDVISNQILILALLGLTGFISGKTRYLPEQTGVILSRVVIKLTAPFLIFTTLAATDFSGGKINRLYDGLFIYIFAIVFILTAFLVGEMSGRLMKLRNATHNVYRMQFMFGNVIFMAFPLLTALFKEEGLIYAVFFNLANDTILWTLGIYLVNKHNTNQWKDNIKHLVNGNTIAFAAGIAAVVIQMKFDSVLDKVPYFNQAAGVFMSTFNPLGKTTIYLSMLFIGLILSQIKINSVSELLKRYPIFILSLSKLLLMPLLALVVLTPIIRHFDLNPFIRTIIVLQLAMPGGTIVPALAAQYDSDYEYATECVFFTTILAFFTLPGIVQILDFIK